MRRGQFILEFLILVALAVIIGIVYLAVSSELLISTGEDQRAVALDDLGFRIQDEIITATKVEDGYQRNITLPDMAGRFQYSLANDATTITLASGSMQRVYETPIVSGTFQKGANLIQKNGIITVVSG
jgi:hypothetical protein